MGRDTPELPDQRMFSASEIAMLIDFAVAGGFPVPGRERPEDPAELKAVSLGQALLLVDRIGGYLNRKNDSPPGHQTVWESHARLVTGRADHRADQEKRRGGRRASQPRRKRLKRRRMQRRKCLASVPKATII